MKILRIRRGFTTNSSASSEWVPPPWQQNALGFRKGPNAPGYSPSGSPLPGTGMPGATAESTGVSGSAAPATGAPAAGLAGNSLTIGLVVAGVVALFAVDRLARRWLRRNKDSGA